MPDWLQPWLAPALLVGLFTWLRADINTLRTELRGDINTLRAELSNRIDGLAATVADIDRRVARLEGMFSVGSAGRVHQPQAEAAQAEAEQEQEATAEPRPPRRQVRRHIDLSE